MGDKDKKLLKLSRRTTKVNLETSGEFELRSISGKDAEVIATLLEKIKDPNEFTIHFLYNQLSSPEIDFSKFKKIPENELEELARAFIKDEYNLSEYFTKTTDEEFFSNFRTAIQNYLTKINKSIINSFNTIRKFSFNYSNVIRPVNLESMIPKMNIPLLLTTPKIPPVNLSKMVAHSVVNTNSIISLSTGLNSISKTINQALIPQINFWNNWAAKNRSIFQNYGRLWKKFEEEYKIAEEEAIKCLKKYKWFMTPSLPIDFVYNAVRICKRGGNQTKVMNKLFIGYFLEDEFTELENMVESWKDKEIFKPRMKILRDCVSTLKSSSSNCNASNLVIPTLITQIDGIQRDFMNENDLKVTRQGLMDSDGNVLVNENGDKIYWKDWYGNLTTDDEILDSANDIFLNILFQKSQTGEPLETPFTFSRHKILHGESIRYGRKTNTIRAFLILDFLASLIEDQT